MLHSQLPIFKVAYDLLGVAADYAANFPRAYKPVLGKRIVEVCEDLLALIHQANTVADRVPVIATLLLRQGQAEVLLRLCHDKRFISDRQYAKGDAKAHLERAALEAQT